jgi:hypothetical protein
VRGPDRIDPATRGQGLAGRRSPRGELGGLARLASLVIDRSPHRDSATIRALYATDAIGFVLATVALIGDDGRLSAIRGG